MDPEELFITVYTQQLSWVAGAVGLIEAVVSAIGHAMDPEELYM
jgi:hypothetical protein